MACALKLLYAGNSETRAPLPLVYETPIDSKKGSGSRLLISLKFCKRRTRVYETSIRAYCSDRKISAWMDHRQCGGDGLYSRPMQTLGPPLNGMYAQLFCVFRIAHLSGLNSSASAPKRSFLLCILWRLNATKESLATKTFDLPSGPPPRGSVVSLFARRCHMGRVG